jgi:hypothetical protein
MESENTIQSTKASKSTETNTSSNSDSDGDRATAPNTSDNQEQVQSTSSSNRDRATTSRRIYNIRRTPPFTRLAAQRKAAPNASDNQEQAQSTSNNNRDRATTSRRIYNIRRTPPFTRLAAQRKAQEQAQSTSSSNRDRATTSRRIDNIRRTPPYTRLAAQRRKAMDTIREQPQNTSSNNSDEVSESDTISNNSSNSSTSKSTNNSNRNSNRNSNPNRTVPQYNQEERHGVTRRTHARRTQALKWMSAEMKRMRVSHPSSNILSIAADRMYERGAAPSTVLSMITTFIAEARRSNLEIRGDPKGLVNEWRRRVMKAPVKRAKPLTTEMVQDILQLETDIEIHSLMVLMWVCAARLTSITGILNENIFIDAPNVITITFNTGKTILATGPYSIRVSVPTKTVNWIQLRKCETTQGKIFRSNEEQYYRLLSRRLKPKDLEVRSFRRGAAQELSKEHPDLIRIFTRHTSNKTLYQYLDSGRFAEWELRETQRMSESFWRPTSANL